MTAARRQLDLTLLAVTLALLAGGALIWLGQNANWPARLWLLASLPALSLLLFDIGSALRKREPGLDVLALLAIGGAAVMNEMLTAAVIATMVMTGRALEGYASARAERSMAALLSRAPHLATRYLPDGALETVGLEDIDCGDKLLVRSGEVLPVDGTLLAAALLDESALTGEALPVAHSAGESTASGTLNAGAPFDLLAAACAADSTYAGIIRLVAGAQENKAPSARLADRYALLFVPLALLMAAGAWLASGDVHRALAVLVVATPCPLLLAVPVALVSGMSACARRGILIKSGSALEKLAQAQQLFFDKTGTLTGGQARLIGIEADGIAPDELLRIAASLEQASAHVTASAVVQAARQRGQTLSPPQAVEECAGAGLSGLVDGQSVRVGTFEYAGTGMPTPPWSGPLQQNLDVEGESGVFVAIDGRLAGALRLADQIRLDTPRALRLLRRAGIEQLTMLTGDRHDAAEAVGAALGVDCVLAEQTPADKLAAIEQARKASVVVMVGDGINDAPALAAADVGVAMGARGVAASAQAADIVVLSDRLDRLAEALLSTRRARRIALESVLVGMGMSLAAMLAAAFGLIPPLGGAILQEFIDLAAIVNALRALQGNSLSSRGTLAPAEHQRLQAEHAALAPLLERIGHLAARLPELEAHEAAHELRTLAEGLEQQLLPHEQTEETHVYPALVPMLGGDDPLASLSHMHREIAQAARRLRHRIDALPEEGPNHQDCIDLQRQLYGFDAVLRLHFTLEDELYHTLEDSP